MEHDADSGAEDAGQPVPVTEIQTVAEMGVVSGAAATARVTVPVPSLVAASTQPRRLPVMPQLPVPAAVTLSQGLQGWRRHDYHAQKGTLPMVSS